MAIKVQIDDEVRDATAEEIARIETDRENERQRVASIEQIAAAKASAQRKLAALGLTEEEVGALLGR